MLLRSNFASPEEADRILSPFEDSQSGIYYNTLLIEYGIQEIDLVTNETISVYDKYMKDGHIEFGATPCTFKEYIMNLILFSNMTYDEDIHLLSLYVALKYFENSDMCVSLCADAGSDILPVISKICASLGGEGNDHAAPVLRFFIKQDNTGGWCITEYGQCLLEWLEKENIYSDLDIIEYSRFFSA